MTSTLKGAIDLLWIKLLECALAYLPLLATSFRGWVGFYRLPRDGATVTINER